MKAMVIEKTGEILKDKKPLAPMKLPEPTAKEGEIVIKVSACGVCHTELDEIEGRTPPSTLPMVPGHQVVGTVSERGKNADKFQVGDRVGVAWIYSSCQDCLYCGQGLENLCDDFMATGRDANGGYAEYMKVHQHFAHKIPEVFADSEAAPLLCAGAIGYRSLRLTGIENGQTLGLTGFGASAHLVLKMVAEKFPDTRVYVFARNEKEREFASELGAIWTGETEADCPEKLDAIIDTTPAWKPVVEAMKNLAKNGRLVINAIRKEDRDKDYLQKLDYTEHLWMEKEIKSVANVASKDVREFLTLAAQIPIRPDVTEFSLEDANQALLELKQQKIRGAKVIRLD